MIHVGNINCSLKVNRKIGKDIEIDNGAICEFGYKDIMIYPVSGEDVSGIALCNRYHKDNNGVVMTFATEESIDNLIDALLIVKETLQDIKG